MIIRKKEIKPICDSLSILLGPFACFDAKGKRIYETTGFQTEWHKEYKQRDISVENVRVAVIAGPSDKMDLAVNLIELYLKTLLEKRSLSAHTLQKYKELNFFSKLTDIFSSTIYLDNSLRSATQLIKQEMNVENGSVMVKDPKGSKVINKES